MQLTGSQPLDPVLDFGIKQGVNWLAKQALSPVIKAAEGAIFGVTPAAGAAPIVAAEGGGVAAGSGLFSAEATGLGFMDGAAFGGAAGAEAAGMGLLGGAMAAFGPALLALAVFQMFDALSPPSRSRPLDDATVRWNGTAFVAERGVVAGDDGTGKLADQVAARLNTYYAARPFDPAAYVANDPYRPQQSDEPGAPQLATPEPDRIAQVTRFIPDYRTPTVGYSADVGYAGDVLMLAGDDDLVQSTIRRVLLRAGESAEAVDAFMGGADKGRAGALPLPQDLPRFDSEPGSPTPSPAAQQLLVEDAAMRDQSANFTPIAAYQGLGAGAPATSPKVYPRGAGDPSVPSWRSDWLYGRDAPTTKPADIDQGLWDTWQTATADQKSNAWRAIGADPWRELTGLTPL